LPKLVTLYDEQMLDTQIARKKIRREDGSILRGILTIIQRSRSYVLVEYS